MTDEEIVGCEYCRDEANYLIDGLASDREWMTVLLECPQCGQYYRYCGVEPHYRPPLTVAEAAACFPDAFRTGRPNGVLFGCGSSRTPSTFTSMPPAWRTSTATALAKQMYESRDFSAMPILADALQDAGCTNEDVLNHCRDAKQVHVRGCWVVDLVLGLS
jgi:hypothetical protein